VNHKIAFTVWENRISPVMESSCRLCLFSFEREQMIQQIDLPGNAAGNMEIILSHNPGLLVCGSLTKLSYEWLLRNKTSVAAFISGPVESVFDAIRNCSDIYEQFSMPGCDKAKYCRIKRRQSCSLQYQQWIKKQ
jgi:hypothetical protein